MGGEATHRVTARRCTVNASCRPVAVSRVGTAIGSNAAFAAVRLWPAKSQSRLVPVIRESRKSRRQRPVSRHSRRSSVTDCAGGISEAVLHRLVWPTGGEGRPHVCWSSDRTGAADPQPSLELPRGEPQISRPRSAALPKVPRTGSRADGSSYGLLRVSRSAHDARALGTVSSEQCDTWIDGAGCSACERARPG